MKYWTSSDVFQYDSSSGTQRCWNLTSTLFSVPQGTSDAQRMGRTILVHYVDFRILYSRTTVTDGTDTFPLTQAMALFFVLDNQNNGNAIPPDYNLIWEGADTGTTDPEEICAFPRSHNEMRFEILKEIVWPTQNQVPWTTDLATGSQQSELEGFIKFRVPINRLVTFRNGTNSPADNQGTLFVKFTNNNGGDNTDVFVLQSRCCFDDATSILQ